MTKYFKTILDEVNKLTKDKPLIYFTREVERAIGLEEYLGNYYICCIEHSDTVDYLIQKGINVLCLEKEGIELLHKSTGNLLSQDLVENWIKTVSREKGFYALTFIPTNTINYKINELGGTLLGNAYELNLQFESKISAAKALTNTGIRTPKTETKYIHEIDHDYLINQFGEKFVLQEDRAHTGSGTFVGPSRDDFNNLRTEKAGNVIKISEYIDGFPITNNICIYNNSIYIGGLQYQITGIPELTDGFGSTVGNDFGWLYSKSISDELIVDLTTEISKIGRLLLNSNYKGIFGVDMIVKNEEAYLIEINARQTANIPFQTSLELKKDDEIPQLLLHIAALLDIKIDIEYQHMANLLGSQVFLRAKNDTVLKNHEFKSGSYRLQSDNSAINWDDLSFKDNVIFLDEDRDKPLIYKSENYSINSIPDSEFLIHFQNKNSSKRKFDEIARIQLSNSAVDENQTVKPWVLEAMRKFEEKLI